MLRGISMPKVVFAKDGFTQRTLLEVSEAWFVSQFTKFGQFVGPASRLS